MNKVSYFLITSYCLLNTLTSQAAPIDPATLIRVTPDNQAKCIEYYTHNKELYCSTTVQNSQPPDPHLKEYEKLNIVFDNRYWMAAWGKQTSEFTTIEYTPNEEDINDWHELITSQFFPGLQEKVTPKQFADLYIKRLKDLGFNPIISFLVETDNQVIFEVRIKQPQNQIQDELQMITSDDKGLYDLHYVIKEADMGQKNREKWVQNLKDSTIKNKKY